MSVENFTYTTGIPNGIEAPGLVDLLRHDETIHISPEKIEYPISFVFRYILVYKNYSLLQILLNLSATNTNVDKIEKNAERFKALLPVTYSTSLGLKAKK